MSDLKTFKPYGNRVYLKMVSDMDEKTASGIIIPSTNSTSKTLKVAEVLACGDDCDKVKVGEKVYIEETLTNNTIRINGVEVVKVNENVIEGKYESLDSVSEDRVL